MRELKFRVWDKSVEHLYEVQTLIDGGDVIGRYVLNGEMRYIHLCADEIIVEQYTGLKDKNGKEIYEGDILGDIWGGGYIAWCDKCKQLQYHISTHECMACLGDVQWYELVNDNGKLEVIGNIHENPELLGNEE